MGGSWDREVVLEVAGLKKKGQLDLDVWVEHDQGLLVSLVVLQGKDARQEVVGSSAVGIAMVLNTVVVVDPSENQKTIKVSVVKLKFSLFVI